jgi:hypothetical protein
MQDFLSSNATLIKEHKKLKLDDGLSMNTKLEFGMLTWKWMKMFMDDNFGMDEFHQFG